MISRIRFHLVTAQFFLNSCQDKKDTIIQYTFLLFFKKKNGFFAFFSLSQLVKPCTLYLKFPFISTNAAIIIF